MAKDAKDVFTRAKEMLDAMPALNMAIGPSMRHQIELAARMQETVIAIANVTGHTANEVQSDLSAWVATLPFPYAEMLPIAKRNVMAALPMTRLPAFKKMEITCGSKYVPGGMGRTWEEVIPFEW